MKLFLLLTFVTVILADQSRLLQEFRNSNNQFIRNVYKELRKSESGNFILAPLSVEIALALVQIVARGETARQLALGTHLPENPDEILKVISALTPSLKGTDKYSFEVANKVYVNKDYTLHDQYKSNVVDIFEADVENSNFANSVESANQINRWVKERTHEKITDLIDSGWLNKDTRVVLINAMYFKGQWITEFKKTRTQTKPFYIDNRHYVNVDLMNVKSQFNYFENKDLDAKFLELPYEGNDVTMTIVLPNDPEGLPALENNLARILMTPKYDYETVNVHLPKFEVESTIQFKEILQAMGVVLPFEDSAQFKDIIVENEPLKISKIVQKVCIEVDEQGTTAAAASAVIMELARSARVFNDKIFRADHPFIFYLKHKVAGITFVGRYSKPEGDVNEGKYERPPERFSKFNFVRV